MNSRRQKIKRPTLQPWIQAQPLVAHLTRFWPIRCVSVVPALCFLCTFLLSCSPSTTTSGAMNTACERITNASLANLFKQHANDAYEYLQHEYNTSVEQMSETATTPAHVPYTNTYYSWSDDFSDYQLVTYDSMPRVANVFFRVNPPALARVIECLGAPTHYSLRYGSAGDSRPFLIGELFYLDKGIIAKIGATAIAVDATNLLPSTTEFTAALDPSTPVNSLRLVEANQNIETMDWLSLMSEWQPVVASMNAYIRENQLYYQSVYPWPGAIKRMKLTYIAPHLLSTPSAESQVSPIATP